MGSDVRVFYTSDLHIGHRMVSGLRGFWDTDLVNENDESLPDTDEHDEQLADNWDSVVRPQDTVFVLGDIAVGQYDKALAWVAGRNGTKHLISGNHDPVHPMRTNAVKLLPKWHEVFATVQPFGRRKLLGQTVLMSHFPYDGDHTDEDRLPQYRLPDLGELLLHGHTHSKRIQESYHTYHVGLDTHEMQLVPQEQILDWIETRIKES